MEGHVQVHYKYDSSADIAFTIIQRLRPEKALHALK